MLFCVFTYNFTVISELFQNEREENAATGWNDLGQEETQEDFCPCHDDWVQEVGGRCPSQAKVRTEEK